MPKANGHLQNHVCILVNSQNRVGMIFFENFTGGEKNCRDYLKMRNTMDLQVISFGHREETIDL